MAMGVIQTRPMHTGLCGVGCSLLGILSWIGYGVFATRGINAVIARESEAAQRMASYAGWFSIAQLVLGITSVVLGWNARVRAGDSPLTRTLGVSAICLGVLVLTLLMVF
jgi:hypothetical protein